MRTEMISVSRRKHLINIAPGATQCGLSSLHAQLQQNLNSLGAASFRVGGAPAGGNGVAAAATACRLVGWPPPEDWAATAAGTRPAAPEARGAWCRGPVWRVYRRARVPAGHRRRCCHRASQDAAQGSSASSPVPCLVSVAARCWDCGSSVDTCLARISAALS